jgi:Flp pilus assembly protein TadG
VYRHALNKLKRWLLELDEDARRAPRTTQPEVVVHYWDGSVPEGRELRDISQTGAYIYTRERWYPGTIIRIVLQGNQTLVQEPVTAPGITTCVSARVVRHGSDGIGVEFAFQNEQERKCLRDFLAAIPAQPAGPASPPAAGPLKGQALIEFALIVPLVFLMAVNAVNFGGFIYAWITVADAARSGADYMILSSDSPGAPTPATLAQIKALITSDVASLKNNPSITVTTCTNSTASSNGCTTFTDPEAPTYTLATVDVTYTYKPLIPLFSFPALGIGATLPSGTIHRKAVMRMLQ